MTILPCSVAGCEAATYIKKHQLCQQHYHRFISNRDLCIEAAATDCKQCGDQIGRAQGRNGPPPMYCSEQCRGRAGYERRIASGTAALVNAKRRAMNATKPLNAIQCIQCRETFESRRTAPKFCSTTCNNRWRDEHNQSRCSEVECERGVRAKGLCSMHWRSKARVEGREANPEWDERRKANYQQRRALKLQLPADNIRPADVYERDEWVCGICSTPVDRTLTHPDPMSPSLDHILPLSRGGHHTMDNVTLAHLSCNVRKGNRVEADAMSA